MLAIEKIGCFIFLGWMSLFDIKSRRLPVLYIAFGFMSALAVRIIFNNVPLRPYITASVIGIIFILISGFSKEKIGYGDSFMILITGMLLGIENLMFVLFSAFIMCFVTGIVIMYIRKSIRNMSLPFVPFLFAAFILLMGLQKWAS